MSDNFSSNKRIAKNTVILYVGMLYGLFVALFTTRVVLRALGEVDYGIYNVVGSIVTMFVFLRSAMGNATHRFITYSIGKGNIEDTKIVFSTGLIIHLGISLLVVLLAETAGLYFLYYKMVIPAERMIAAQWCYQFSVLTCALSVICVPYDAAIIAHEKMKVYTFINILQSTLNIVIAYILVITSNDKLIVYGLLMLSVQIFNRLFYGFYCKKHFEECQFRWVIDKSLLKNMTSFAGWKLLGHFAGIAYTQGVNILLNMFCGPIVNAARAIAVQVQNAIRGFVTNFQTAVNPQITKSYAKADYNRVHELLFMSSKFSFFLLLFFVLPVFLEARQILDLWLGEYPEHTLSFLRISLLIMLIDPLENPISISNDAAGNIRNYQITAGLLNISIVVFAYILLKLGYPPEGVFIVQLLVCSFVLLVKVFMVKARIRLSMRTYLYKLLFRIGITAGIAFIPPYLVHYFFTDGLLSIILTLSCSVITTALVIYYIGLAPNERIYVLGIIQKGLDKIDIIKRK